jgi:hypothetical protein
LAIASANALQTLLPALRKKAKSFFAKTPCRQVALHPPNPLDLPSAGRWFSSIIDAFVGAFDGHGLNSSEPRGRTAT